MRADTVPEAVLPEYELTDHTAKRRRLSDLQGPDPVALPQLRCLPDWDITSPELKAAAWKREEEDRFYPYGKSYAQVFGEQD